MFQNQIKMKHKSLFLAFLFLSVKISAQSGNLEFMAGHSYFHYQHSMSKTLKKNGSVGWQHIATLIKQYENNPEKGGVADELMNQVYITFKTSRTISFKGGLFYTNTTGFKPSAAIQFLFMRKQWMMIVSPRIDVMKNPSYEIFMVTNYSPSINDKWKLHFRLQAMSSVSRFHDRSYQLARIGAGYKGLQFGAGINFDEYGKSFKLHNNAGIYFQAAL